MLAIERLTIAAVRSSDFLFREMQGHPEELNPGLVNRMGLAVQSWVEFAEQDLKQRFQIDGTCIPGYLGIRALAGIGKLYTDAGARSAELGKTKSTSFSKVDQHTSLGVVQVPRQLWREADSDLDTDFELRAGTAVWMEFEEASGTVPQAIVAWPGEQSFPKMLAIWPSARITPVLTGWSSQKMKDRTRVYTGVLFAGPVGRVAPYGWTLEQAAERWHVRRFDALRALVAQCSDEENPVRCYVADEAGIARAEEICSQPGTAADALEDGIQERGLFREEER